MPRLEKKFLTKEQFLDAIEEVILEVDPTGDLMSRISISLEEDAKTR